EKISPSIYRTLSRAGLTWRKCLRRRRLTRFSDKKWKNGGGSQCQDFFNICGFAHEFEGPDLTRRGVLVRRLQSRKERWEFFCPDERDEGYFFWWLQRFFGYLRLFSARSMCRLRL